MKTDFDRCWLKHGNTALCELAVKNILYSQRKSNFEYQFNKNSTSKCFDNTITNFI